MAARRREARRPRPAGCPAGIPATRYVAQPGLGAGARAKARVAARSHAVPRARQREPAGSELKQRGRIVCRERFSSVRGRAVALAAAVISLVVLAMAHSATGQPRLGSPVPVDSEIRKMLADRVDRLRPGVCIVVGVIEPQGRRIVTYGSVDENDPRPPSGDTLFEIGSITKVLTSLLLADMVQRREVALSDPVAKFL